MDTSVTITVTDHARRRYVDRVNPSHDVADIVAAVRSAREIGPQDYSWHRFKRVEGCRYFLDTGKPEAWFVVYVIDVASPHRWNVVTVRTALTMLASMVDHGRTNADNPPPVTPSLGLRKMRAKLKSKAAIRKTRAKADFPAPPGAGL